MNFRDFSETIKYTWNLKDPNAPKIVPLTRTKGVKSRDVASGHWQFNKYLMRRHIRWNTVIYTEPAHLYEAVEEGITTTQTLYYGIGQEKAALSGTSRTCGLHAMDQESRGALFVN